MNKFIKIGGLLLLIALPIFLVIILHTFGENKYEVKTYFPEKIIGDNDTSYYKVPHFSLNDQNGKPFVSDSTSNHIYVVDFFFTRCGSICPKMTSQLARVQEKYKDVKSLKILSITVDPEYDSISVLKAYSKIHKAVDGFWYFATADADYIYKLAKTGFKLNAMENSSEESEDFVHSDKLVLMDSKRHIRGYYDGTNREEVDRLMVELGILLLNKNN